MPMYTKLTKDIDFSVLTTPGQSQNATSDEDVSKAAEGTSSKFSKRKVRDNINNDIKS